MHRILKAFGLLTVACALNAAVKLPALISDHMVLQQGMPVSIWGTADPGETVKVEFQGQSVTGNAAGNGKWAAWLKPLVTGGAMEMTVKNAQVTDGPGGGVWGGPGSREREFRH